MSGARGSLEGEAAAAERTVAAKVVLIAAAVLRGPRSSGGRAPTGGCGSSASISRRGSTLNRGPWEELYKATRKHLAFDGVDPSDRSTQ